MLLYAVKKGITADYVLTDSWFTCWELVKTCLDNGLEFIGMFSKYKTKFTYNGKDLTYKEIRSIDRKRIKRSKRFNLYYISCYLERAKSGLVLYTTREERQLEDNDQYQLKFRLQLHD